jgi:hypothetical protein
MKVKLDIHFVLIALVITLSIGDLNKQFFTLDFPIGPNIFKGHFIPTFYGFAVPIWGGHLVWKIFYTSLAFLFSAALMQKIILLIILSLSAISAYHAVPTDSKPAKIFASLLYMLNPYVYVRILAGHWLYLFAYAVLPLAIKSFTDLLENNNRKDIIKVVLLTTLVGFNSHTLVMAFIAYIVIFCFKVYRVRDIEIIKSVSITAPLFLVLSTYWLLPLVTAKETLLSSIGSEDLAAFAPRIESFSALFTLASMHGFWRAGYVYAKDFIPYWQILFAFILFLAVHGFISYHKDKKIGVYVRSFAVIAALGLILAAGIRSPFEDAFRVLFDNIPLLKGMRDSHKFVTLLILSYAYLGALGVAEISKGIQQKERKRYINMAVVGFALATPFVYSYTFFNGFAGQIKPTDYPKDWYEVNEYLNKDEQDFNLLFLPWHMYLDFKWIPNRDKRIANPAEHFFDKQIISGKNIEIGGIYRQVNTPEQLYIDFLLRNRGKITNLGELLALLNVKYVLLTKEADYKRYFFLFNQSDLTLVKETENFYVFKNEHEVAKIYEVDGIVYIRGWRELLERSRNEDITTKLYVIGNTTGKSGGKSKRKALEYERKNPVRYELKEQPSKRYVVFTEPYSEHWMIDGKKPLKAYGVVNAYEVDDDKGEIKYERFYNVYLPSYMISMLTFTALVLMYLKSKNSKE